MKKQIVCACIIQQDKVLIGKRRSNAYNGIWEFPGGKVELDESNECAIIREIKEELNLDIEVITKLGEIEDATKECILSVHCYACKVVGGQMQLNAHSELLWVSPVDISLSSFHQSDAPLIRACSDFMKFVAKE